MLCPLLFTSFDLSLVQKVGRPVEGKDCEQQVVLGDSAWCPLVLTCFLSPQPLEMLNLKSQVSSSSLTLCLSVSLSHTPLLHPSNQDSATPSQVSTVGWRMSAFGAFFCCLRQELKDDRG